mgnify:CR=1 FL=1
MMGKDWIEVELGEVCHTTSGGTPSRKIPEYFSGDIPWVKSGELNYNVIMDTEEHISDDAIANSNARVFPKGTLLIALYGATIGKLAILGIPAATNQAVCGIYQNDILETRFLFYYLFHRRQKLIEQGAGGAQPNISQAILKRLCLLIAPLPEQRTIVSKIEQLFSELDNGIDSLKAAKKKLEIYRQAVLKRAFEGELTKEWRKKQADLPSAGKLLEGIADEWRKFQKSQLHEWKQAIEEWERNGRQGRKPSKPAINTGIKCVSSKASTQKKGKDFWITTTLGQLGIIICGQSPKISEVNTRGEGILYITGPEQWDGKEIKKNKWTLLPKRIAPDGSIFITVKGAGVGKLFPGTRCAIGRDIYAFKPGPFMNYSYVYYALKHSIDEVIMKAQGDIPGLSKNHIMDHCIGLCSKREQDQIVHEIETRLSVCDNILDSIEKGLEKAESLRQSILKKAFEGKLLSEEELAACKLEPDWEPADKLLERIRKQRNGKI